jgi:hypothetical protein
MQNPAQSLTETTVDHPLTIHCMRSLVVAFEACNSALSGRFIIITGFNNIDLTFRAKVPNRHSLF